MSFQQILSAFSKLARVPALRSIRNLRSKRNIMNIGNITDTGYIVGIQYQIDKIRLKIHGRSVGKKRAFHFGE